MPIQPAIFSRILFASSVLAATAARADDATAPAPAVKAVISTNGYIDSRFTYTHVNTSGALPTSDIPGFSNLTEGNLVLKLNWGDKAQMLADLSFIGQVGSDYRSSTGAVGDHDVPAYQSLAVLSEAYGTYNFTEHFNVTLGKKRVVWGPGYTFNPTDVLNPPKDPTNPAFQREGQWLARIEFPYRNFTFSFVGAAKTLVEYGGLPAALLYYPKYPTAEEQQILNAENTTTPYQRPDSNPHFATAARVYALIADTDLSLFYYYTNQFNDDFYHKSRVGAAISRVFGYWEVHFEGMFQTGYSNLYANPACVTSPEALENCALARTATGYTGLNSSTFVAKPLFGARYTLDNASLLSFEYYYNGEGYTPSQFGDYVRLVRYGAAALATLPASEQSAIPGLPGSSSSSQTGVPQLFTFNPLRRHYAFIAFQQPQIHNDWTVGATLILDCEDLSGLIAPMVAWAPLEWLSRTLGGFVGIPGVSSWGATVASWTPPATKSFFFPTVPALPQASYTEFGIVPFNWELFFAVRAFY